MLLCNLRIDAGPNPDSAGAGAVRRGPLETVIDRARAAPSVGSASEGNGERILAPLTFRGVLTSERVLQVILLVTLAANVGAGGLSEVALPALAHGPLYAGAGGYGGLIAAFGGGALVGTLVAAQIGRPSRPALLASAVFLLEALILAIVPTSAGCWP